MASVKTGNPPPKKPVCCRGCFPCAEERAPDADEIMQAANRAEVGQLPSLATASYLQRNTPCSSVWTLAVHVLFLFYKKE